MEQAPVSATLRKRVLKVVTVSLLLDLISFTFILPLFPRLLSFYLSLEDNASSSSPTLLSRIIHTLNAYKATFNLPISSEYDVVLLGGALGSLFSFLQAIAAPVLGRISDTHGRRPALLLSMCGNIVSVLLWLLASDFRTFLLSRVVGGLSEGNVQLAITIATDVSTDRERGKTMAIVGGCFSVAFTFGPALGAWLSSKQWVKENPFGVAAGFSLALIVLETVYLYFSLPETHPTLRQKEETTKQEVNGQKPSVVESTKKVVKGTNTHASLNFTHLSFILLFSGIEFSLPFLTSTVFNYPPSHNGRLLGFIGLLSSLLQGGVTRRLHALTNVRLGITSCLASMIILSTPGLTEKWLWIAAGGLAVTSATVVTGLNSLASFEANVNERGVKLGGLRSAGQVGRAVGPLLFCSLYWGLGREKAYMLGVAGMVPVVGFVFARLKDPEIGEAKKRIEAVASKKEL